MSSKSFPNLQLGQVKVKVRIIKIADLGCYDLTINHLIASAVCSSSAGLGPVGDRRRGGEECPTYSSKQDLVVYVLTVKTKI